MEIPYMDSILITPDTIQILDSLIAMLICGLVSSAVFVKLAEKKTEGV